MTSSHASVPPQYLPLIPQSPSQRPPLLHIYLWLVQHAPTPWIKANGERSSKASNHTLCPYIPVARTNANARSGGQAPLPRKLGYSRQPNSYSLFVYPRNLSHSQSSSPSPQPSQLPPIRLRSQNKSRWSGRANVAPGAYVLVVNDTRAKMPRMNQGCCAMRIARHAWIARSGRRCLHYLVGRVPWE